MQQPFGMQPQYSNQGYSNSYNQNSGSSMKSRESMSDFTDTPEPNTRSVESNIEGEVESFDSGSNSRLNDRIDNSITPGDDSSYDSYWDEDKTSSLLHFNNGSSRK